MNTCIVYTDYLDALRSGDRRAALRVAQQALSADLDIRDLYIDVFQRAMHEVGHLWETNQMTVAQEHLATAITQSVIAHLYSHVFTAPLLGRKMVATCIGGELHELGIRMVSDFFEMEGWEVWYLGANMPIDEVVTIVNDQQADLLGISASLNPHVTHAREMIAAVRASPIGPYIKIMVGGHPFNRLPTLYETIGADFTAPDAREAVLRASEVMV
jgi:methanogenic corrinoid protein MtbC1